MIINIIISDLTISLIYSYRVSPHVYKVFIAFCVIYLYSWFCVHLIDVEMKHTYVHDYVHDLQRNLNQQLNSATSGAWLHDSAWLQCMFLRIN